MYVQMCIKGVNGIEVADAQAILTSRGLACNWWREAHHISSADIADRLTSEELDLHVNSYEDKHPLRGGLVKQETPFISLTSGAVTRHSFLKTNLVHPAHLTALNFASDFGLEGHGFLFYCWVVVGLRPSVQVRHLAEEVRELNTYRRYSAFQPEGEIAAKIEVPASQISRYEHYEFRRRRGKLRWSCVGHDENPNYIDPQSLTNFRDWF